MKHWAQAEERGIIWGMRALLKCYLFFGRGFLQIFLYPVTAYYWLTNRPARQASRDYLARVRRYSNNSDIDSGYPGSIRHFMCFSNAIIDKLAAWSGTLTLADVDYHGREAVFGHLQNQQGVLLFGSHLGNMEVCRVIATLRKNIRVNVLVHTKHAEKFNALLNEYAKSDALTLIQVTDINAAVAIRLKDMIDNGEIVVIAADRTPVNGLSRVSEADFLGAPALFPQGPHILAGLLKCPVFTMFCLKEGDKQVIYFDHFSDGMAFKRHQRDAEIQKSIQQFADTLQRYCSKAPLQWFNFYNFWQSKDETSNNT